MAVKGHEFIDTEVSTRESSFAAVDRSNIEKKGEQIWYKKEGN